MKIKTTHHCPPILDFSFDWSAYDEDTYDGAPDSRCPLGWGQTEKAAVQDLHDQMHDQIVMEFEDDPGSSYEENEARLKRELRKLEEQFKPILANLK